MQEIPSRPSRPLNPYFRFRAEFYQKVREENPKLSVVQLTQILTSNFKNLSEEERLKYETPYQAEYENWKKLNEEYKAKYGEEIRQKNKISKRKLGDKPKEKKKHRIRKAKAGSDGKADESASSRGRLKSSSANVPGRKKGRDAEVDGQRVECVVGGASRIRNA